MPKVSSRDGEAWNLESSPLTSVSWALSPWKKSTVAVTPAEQPTGIDVGGTAEADQSSTQPDDTQAQQFLTHGHPSRDSTHCQCPHPGSHPTAATGVPSH